MVVFYDSKGNVKFVEYFTMDLNKAGDPGDGDLKAIVLDNSLQDKIMDKKIIFNADGSFNRLEIKDEYKDYIEGNKEPIDLTDDFITL